MKQIIILITLLFGCTSTYAQSFKLLPKTSSLQWTGYGEVGNFSQSGTLKCKEGSFQLETGLITEGTLVFDMKSIQHSDRKLENHLKADDFFHVKKYPTASFQIISDTSSNVCGVLTMHGISNKVSMDINIHVEDDRILITGILSIDRTKYDIKYNSSSYFQDLGNYAIKNEFDIAVDLVFARE
jgi:polyisoprenoid-binding protein YceI